jgi:molybdopterin/thiamine biosynthesis adenylyltransferase
MYEIIHFIGCGGTGAHLIENTVRMIYFYHQLHNTPLPVIIIQDPDNVEHKNCQRQNFSFDDIGYPKAEIIAKRISNQYGISIQYILSHFNEEFSRSSPFYTIYKDSKSYLIIDSIDNISGRWYINNFIKSNYTHNIHWLSIGNTDKYGQLVFYSSHFNKPRTPFEVFVNDFNISKVHEEERITTEPANVINCAVNALIEPQSISINLLAATISTAYLYNVFYNNDDLDYDVVLFNTDLDSKKIKNNKTIDYIEDLENKIDKLSKELDF